MFTKEKIAKIKYYEKENFTNLEEPQKINNYLQKLSYEDLKFDNSFKKIAKNFKVDFLINNDDDIFKRKIADNNFTIETNKVFKIEKEDYKSFIFHINRDNTPDNTIENLIIEKRGDSVKGFFIKYEYSDQYLSDYKKNKNIPFDGNIKVSRKVEKIDELIESITKKEINHTQSKMLFCYYVNVTVDIVCQGMGIGNHTVDDLHCNLIGTSRGPRRYIESKRFCEYGDGGGLISPWSSDGYPNSTNSNSSGEVINNNESNTTINTSCGFLGCTRVANKIASKLGLNQTEREWLNNVKNEVLIETLDTFLNDNNDSVEAKTLSNLIINSLTYNSELDFTQYLKDFQALPSGVSFQNNLPNDPILGNQILLNLVNDAIDGVGNLILIYLEYNSHPANEGKILRLLMPKMGLNIPADVTNKTLGELFSLRKRNRNLVVEYQNETLKGLIIEVAISAFDVVALISPSKGGGAYLLTTGGKTVTLASLSNTLKTLQNQLYTFKGPMLGKTIGHTYKTHGSHLSEICKMRAINGNKNVGQWLDDVASENFIAKHLSQLGNGTRDIPIPSNLQGIGRVFRKSDGAVFKPTHIRLVPSGSGVK